MSKQILFLFLCVVRLFFGRPGEYSLISNWSKPWVFWSSTWVFLAWPWVFLAWPWVFFCDLTWVFLLSDLSFFWCTFLRFRASVHINGFHSAGSPRKNVFFIPGIRRARNIQNLSFRPKYLSFFENLSFFRTWVFLKVHKKKACNKVYFLRLKEDGAALAYLVLTECTTNSSKAAAAIY